MYIIITFSSTYMLRVSFSIQSFYCHYYLDIKDVSDHHYWEFLVDVHIDLSKAEQKLFQLHGDTFSDFQLPSRFKEKTQD